MTRPIEAIFGAAGVTTGITDPLSLAPDLWLRADAVTGHVAGDALSTAPDISGYARDASQGTAGKQPKWFTNVINGHSVFRFDRTASQHFVVPGFFAGNADTSNMSMFIVAKGADTTIGALASMRRASTGWQTRVNSAAANEFMSANLAATPASIRDNVGLVTTSWVIYEMFRTGLTCVIGHNGTLVSNVFSSYTAQTSTPLCIGGEDVAGSGFATGTFYSGDIAEIILWNRKLTLGERDIFTKGYAKPRYNITVN
jgi:hypothetical protein